MGVKGTGKVSTVCIHILFVNIPNEHEEFDLKGTQQAAWWSYGSIFFSEKTIEIELVRPIEVCGKV